jgi:uncharacterized RDD family membrane protein YckC
LTVVDYRCVCGETISLETTTGGQCAKCGRKYAAEALRSAAAETICLADAARGAAELPSVSSTDEPDRNIGRTLGHFRILRMLGQGGMGTVYQALDQSLQRYVALKVIRAGDRGATDSPQLQRLFQEAIAQARVNHPHVVHIYHVGRDGDAPFLAMELVGGTTLAQQLEAGPLGFAEVIEAAIQLTDALRSCQQFDIVHGDIKPNNILLTEAGAVKLSDFGLSARLSQVLRDRPGITGTPNYLAPELAAGGTPDLRSDLYSLGVTFFEMTFGRLPFSFSGSDLQERMRAHQTAQVEFPQPWPRTVPESWQHVLNRLLAKSPDDRYADYRQLLMDLQRLRPIAAPTAGRLQRGLAWAVDYLGTGVGQALITIPLAMLGTPRSILGKPLLAIMLGAACAVPPLLFAGIQTHWGTTPGKLLFQLRIVDRYGLRPNSVRLALRSIAQVLPLWAVVVWRTQQVLGIGFVGIAFFGIAAVATLLDALWALIERNRRSIHDVLFDTRVVLDIGAPDPRRGI